VFPGQVQGPEHEDRGGVTGGRMQVPNRLRSRRMEARPAGYDAGQPVWTGRSKRSEW
jgi:hypothetical protein